MPVEILNNPASAFKVLEPGESVSVDTVIGDDLYICGGNVIVKGTVLGDVLAWRAGRDIWQCYWRCDGRGRQYYHFRWYVGNPRDHGDLNFQKV